MSVERFSFPSPLYVMNFSPWRRRALKPFVKGIDVRFVSASDDIPKRASVLIWGKKTPEGLEGCKIIRAEDGFLRSVGLGAHFVAPLSWVFDTRGIYYDPSTPSDLEYILSNKKFSKSLLKRASILRERIIDLKLSKYNIEGRLWKRPKGSGDRKVILVPGQVESDASIACGSVSVKTNLGLLQVVRSQNPQAYIIYKPHPDVVAGVRSKGSDEDLTKQYCNEVVTDIDSISMIEQVDEVHTLTSLLGFEALLRHKKVVCYGQPFYAGWGLTDDVFPIQRREETRGPFLTLDHLVAAALILYPLYVNPYVNFKENPEVGMCTSPEIVLDILVKQRDVSLGKNGVLRKIWHICLKYSLQLIRFFGLKKE